MSQAQTRPQQAPQVTVNVGPNDIPRIETQEVSRWYGDVVAVSQVNVAVGPGVTALLGPNGSGKSTLLKMISGLVKPSAGDVRLMGELVRSDPEVYRNLGLVPEQETIYPFLTGREFVRLNARLQGVEDIETATQNAINAVDMQEAADRALHGYSKGMRQRIKIAGAIVHDPQIILMDEPLNGTDPLQRVRLIELIQLLGQRGKTVLVSSHVLNEVERFAQQIVVIVNGRLAAAGNFRAIRDKIDEQNRMIRIVSNQPRALAGLMVQDPIFSGVDFPVDDGHIIARVHDARQAYRRIPALAREAAARLYEVGPLDDSLASVFSYVTQSNPNPHIERR